MLSSVHLFPVSLFYTEDKMICRSSRGLGDVAIVEGLSKINLV